MNNTDSPTEVETESYLATFLYRSPKKNHDAITQNLKRFIPWFEYRIIGTVLDISVLYKMITEIGQGNTVTVFDQEYSLVWCFKNSL